MAGTETLLSFVNCWECDENNHMNVQFYASRFEEASRQFINVSGLSESVLGRRKVRQIRFISEVMAATLLKITSSMSFESQHGVSIVHEMFDLESESCIASAVDYHTVKNSEFQNFRNQCAEYEAEFNVQNLPKGSASSNAPESFNLNALFEQGGFTVHRNTVLPRNCGVSNQADDLFVIGCFSDGAAHVWEQTTLTRAWLESKGFGRIALEIKLSYLSPVKLGDSIQIVSGISNIGRKTFGIRHNVLNSTYGELAVVGDIVAAILDLNSRQAVPLPEPAVSRMKELLIRNSD